MVPRHSLIMGNGSIKAPRLEETCMASGIKEAPVWETVEPLKMRIAHLEEELARRDQELRAQEKRLQSLQRELEVKVSQIDKLQDAIGYNSLGCSPPAPLRHSRRLLSVINQGSTRFHRVAVEVHQRLKAKEGVSAEPTSRHFCHDQMVHHISTERQRIRKDSGWVRWHWLHHWIVCFIMESLEYWFSWKVETGVRFSQVFVVFPTPEHKSLDYHNTLRRG